MRSIKTYKQVRRGGRTYVVYIGDECKKLDIGYGDWIEIEIRKAEEDDGGSGRSTGSGPRTVEQIKEALESER